MENSIDNLKTFDDDFTPYTAELKEGQFLGENKNYRLEKNLGAGGMGEVWLASEIRGGVEIRKVVVKTLRPDRRENEGAEAKALEQFRLIQKLNHQNICPIYVIEQDPACGYLIVIGYADGGSYADWFAGQPKPLTEVCWVLLPIADALDFAHRKGVIHRDVKPENMMFTLDGTPWLIDFGIAANLRSRTQATTSQFSQSGTASYMAPEQKTGQLQTAQTDEYSLAMVALEFLTGSLSPLSLFMLSPGLQPIVAKALSPDPSARYTTCREFIEALANAGTTSPAKPTPPSPPAVQVVKKPSLKAGDRKIWTANGIDYAFRWCPAGEFMMGSPTDEPGRDSDETRHRVKITKGFWLLETEVTQSQWKAIMGTTVEEQARKMLNDDTEYDFGSLGTKTLRDLYGFQRDTPAEKILCGVGSDRPIYYVNWNESVEFCRRLSSRLNQRVQLPTEAQWEYACRAGSTTALPNGPIVIKGKYNAPALDPIAWYGGNSSQGFTGQSAWNSSGWPETQYPGGPCGVHAVGKKGANAWGLYDMIGNVLEWCSDYYDADYYDRSPTSDPENTTASSNRVNRGGGWGSSAEYCRSAHRYWSEPESRSYGLGLRVLLVPSPEK